MVSFVEPMERASVLESEAIEQLERLEPGGGVWREGGINREPSSTRDSPLQIKSKMFSDPNFSTVFLRPTNTAVLPITLTAFILHPLSFPTRSHEPKAVALAAIASNCSLPYLAIMKVIRDCFGHSVRLTDERLAHILEHDEMAGMEDELERVLQTPSEVRLSRSADQGFSRNVESSRPILSLKF
jgi:hypothetical protein